jgi:hypothetical protein
MYAIIRRSSGFLIFQSMRISQLASLSFCRPRACRLGSSGSISTPSKMPFYYCFSSDSLFSHLICHINMFKSLLSMSTSIWDDTLANTAGSSGSQGSGAYWMEKTPSTYVTIEQLHRYSALSYYHLISSW